MPLFGLIFSALSNQQLTFAQFAFYPTCLNNTTNQNLKWLQAADNVQQPCHKQQTVDLLAMANYQAGD
jgi:hypothetical protein